MALKLRSSNYRGIEYTPSAAKSAGEYDKRGDVPGFYFEAVASGKKGFIVTDADEVELPCEQESSDQGAKAYWSSTNDQVENASASNQLIGFYTVAKTATPETCLIRLAGSAVAVGT